ncbi:zinc-ribbon domain-containing protein [Methanobacterium sp.]|uniref:zinc-ribbon domain-containing protein n=1 Tax=Methanobacterium sp. TaxID=2164 RepID=UPI0025E8A2EE|nr:zinc-ribbon domain-containing protein [Methanobacterium sp.]MBI5458825.1 zinc-ribbon domain-containing protein [Methanobacterium sp.]
MTRICPNCQTENQDNSSFCQKCGTKLSETVKKPEHDKAKRNKFRQWWHRQSPGVKILSSLGGCCLCVIIILLLISVLFPVTDLYLEKNRVDITYQNNSPDIESIQYVLKGKTESDAKVTIFSSDSRLNNTEVTVDANGNFEYQQQFPKNLTELSVSVTAKAPNKAESYLQVYNYQQIKTR